MTSSNVPDEQASSNGSTESDETPLWSWRGDHPAPSAISGRKSALHSSALQAAETPRMFRVVMLGSVICLGLLALVLTFAPWRQTVSGSGEVTSFSPNARPQSIESQISARIRSWNVVEGDRVAEGDTIVVLQDIKTEYMSDQFVEQIAANRESEIRVLQLETETARQKLLQSEQSLRAAQAKYRNATTDIETARRRAERINTLHDDGLASLREKETEMLKLQKAEADSISAAADLDAARQSLQSARLTVQQKENKLEAKRADLDLKLDNAQQRRQAAVVRAPINGIVARINRAGPGQTVKEGGELAMIVPETGDQAVEMFVSGMDAAIVDTGRRVQLQFSGFPALQFSGFPGASIGTFSGTVKVIDPVDDGSGRYRLLVVPDSTSTAPDWPSTDYLRQGSGVTGWVLLSNVPLGYELWRRINGLPPNIPVRDQTFKRKPK
jgi:multidrug resistance efflux pump